MKKILILFVIFISSTTLYACGNTDTVDPVLTGVDDLSIAAGDVFDPLLEVSATDNVDGDITDKIIFSGSYNVNVVGTYLLSYRVKDSSGNETIRSRTLTVLPTPLFIALEAYHNADNFTMEVSMIHNGENYPILIEVDENKMRVEGIDEILYYEFSENCHIYEMNQAVWQKNSIECSQRDASELQFFINLSEEYFTTSSSNANLYLLKSNYYNSLQTFLGSSITSNFTLEIFNQHVKTIAFNMLRNQLYFEVSITYTNYDTTSIELPVL
jgi:hypothetical protein